MIVKYKGNTIELYDTIEELPSERYFLFNKYLLIDSGLGSDMDSIDARLSRLYTFLSNEKYDEAKQEAINLRNAFYFVLNDINPKMKCFAVMVKKVNGKRLPIDDIPEAVSKIRITGITWQIISSTVDALKKKLTKSMPRIFQSKRAIQ